MTTKKYIMQIKNIYNNIGEEEKMLIKNIINNNIGEEEKMFINEVRYYMNYIEDDDDEVDENDEIDKVRYYIDEYMKEVDKLEKYALRCENFYDDIDDIDEKEKMINYEKKITFLNINKNKDAIERLRKKLKFF